jgi:diadenosine tetraphosphate (Ap4A) HIT family hydrolase
MSCIFCKIIKGEIPSVKIAETAKSYAFMDIGPLSAGHCLVIPKECKSKYHQLSEDSCIDLGLLLNRVARAVGAENYNILQNNGAIANQAVFHVHFHIIPKNSKEDGLVIGWNPDTQADKSKIAALGAEFAEKVKAITAEAEAKTAEKQ